VATRRSPAGFGWGALIGSLGGLVGLGGAELRLPVLVGFARYSASDAFNVLRDERPLFLWMAAGSILGAAVGSLLLGLVPATLLLALLSVLLLLSAVKVFQHAL
jgi:uncharacterized membrane protein YfcA